jgi:outer membrane protein assembly factor BamB
MALPSIPNIQMSLCSPMREMRMRKNVLVVVGLCLLSAAVAARPRDVQTPAVKAPDTPAGRAVTEFVDSFNAGGQTRQTWLETRTTIGEDRSGNVLKMDAQLLQKYGALTVVRIVESSKESAAAVVRHGTSEVHGYLTIAVEAAAPFKVVNFGLRPATPDEIKGVAAPPALPVNTTPPAAIDVAMIAMEGDAAKYWPRWRGPSGQGLAMDKGYVDKWSDTENVKWKTKLETTGNGSPIVWANRIFITTGSANGDSRGIAAFDRATGKKLWETFAPDTNKQPVNLKNGHASSTPTTDGRLVYAYLGPKGVMAVDFAGKLAWHAPVGPMMAPHGPGGSPLLYKDRVIVFQDHQKGGFIAAFDAKTGARRWLTNRTETTGWSTPIAIRAGGRDEIVVSSFRAIYAYNPDNGEVLWKVTHPNPEVIPTPVVGHGLVLASGGRPGPILAVRPGGSGDVTGTHVAWQAPKGAPFVPSPLLYGDELYMLNDQASILTAYDAKSGTVLWQGRLGEVVQSGFSTSPVAVDGKLFFTNEGGETFVVKAGKTFELLHVNTVNEPVLASPAMVDGTWYFRTPFHLMAVGK